MALSIGRLATRHATRSLVPAAPRAIVPATAFRPFSLTARKMVVDGSMNQPVATVDTAHLPSLPVTAQHLFEAKKQKRLTFEAIGKELGRDEVAVAAIFYGQAKASEEDAAKLSKILDLNPELLASLLYGLPDRGRSVPMPPKEPLIYRLYEIVQNYGYAYKAVLNEKFGDGIMSAISFSTNVKKETDDKGDWVVITLRGKWLPFTRF